MKMSTRAKWILAAPIVLAVVVAGASRALFAESLSGRRFSGGTKEKGE
jgi:hypothetical protein